MSSTSGPKKLRINLQTVTNFHTFYLEKGSNLILGNQDDPEQQAVLSIYMSDDDEITLTINPWKFHVEENSENETESGFRDEQQLS